MTIAESAKSIEEHLRQLRREFHRHPEISGNEKKTAARIVRELSEIGGFEIREGVGGHGVIAELSGALPGPVIALRADMDALQIEEETGLSAQKTAESCRPVGTIIILPWFWGQPVFWLKEKMSLKERCG